MPWRGTILVVVLVAPALALLALGPRRLHDIPADRVVIRYWEKWSGMEGLAMQGIVDRFNATVGADQGIWVDYCAISNVDRRTLIATAGGDPPDVAGLFDHVVAQFADQDALTPLDDLAREFGIVESDFKPIWWQMGQYDNRLFALPCAPYTIALFYNRALFREVGLDPDQPPRTIAELDAFAAKLNTRDANGRLTRMGFNPAPALLGWWHWVWPCFFDARLWDGARFQLDTPEGRMALRWIHERRQSVGLQAALKFEAVAGAIEGAQNPFLSGRIGMVFQGPWMGTWARKYAPDLDFGVAPFPSVSADRMNVFAGADVFAIPRGARHPREAMTFIAYVLRQEVMEELCRLHGKLSPYRTPRPDFFETHPHRGFIRVFDEMANSPYAFGHPRMPTFAEASQEMLFMLESVLQGERGPDQAVRETQAKVDAIVADYDRKRAARRAAGD